jgi:hypothetical protein
MLPGPKVLEDSVQVVNADPQINAPNMTITNNPTASQKTYHYPRVQYPQGSPMNTPKMTILPPKEVSPDAYQNIQDQRNVFRSNRKLEQTPPLNINPQMLMGGGAPTMPGGAPIMPGGAPNGNFDVKKITQQVIANLKKTNKNIDVFDPTTMKSLGDSPLSLRSHHSRRRHRKLFGNGFFNAGPGFVDIGSMPMNNVNMASANPNLSSMGPFIPQQAPPSPIHINIKDPWNPKKKKNLMSEGQKMIRRLVSQNVVDKINMALRNLSEDLSNFHDSVSEKLKGMGQVTQETEMIIDKENSSANQVPLLIKQKYNIE